MGERIPQRRRMDVLNGIAWDPDRKRLFITGKLWPRLYEVELRKIEWPPEMDIESSRRMCIK
jgi:glutaminyl-peptide cyclotransferase